MKKIAIQMFSLAALVGMTVISTNAVCAAGTSLEEAKQESGVTFGEMGGLKARGDSSAVKASGDGVSRSALTDVTAAAALKSGRAEIQVPALKKASASEQDGPLFGLLKDKKPVKRGPLGIRHDKANDMLMGTGLVAAMLLFSGALPFAGAIVAAGIGVLAVVAALAR
ncbi:MAG: hypothetical protein ABIG11_05445 [bacterium]